MKKSMKTISAAALLAAICFSALYILTKTGLFLTLAITFGTIAYHLCIRLIIGAFFHVKMGNTADYTRKWYQVSSQEQKFYEKIKIKKWKNKLPTWNPDSLSPAKHSWEAIAQTMCQSELVHETNVVFSFFPILLSLWFGKTAVFVITSFLSAAADLVFVMAQRYNRSRILRMKQRHNKKYPKHC